MFKRRHFDRSVILLCVRWYLAYNLSPRVLEEMMMERGLSADHSTVHRWVSSLHFVYIAVIDRGAAVEGIHRRHPRLVVGDLLDVESCRLQYQVSVVRDFGTGGSLS